MFLHWQLTQKDTPTHTRKKQEKHKEILKRTLLCFPKLLQLPKNNPGSVFVLAFLVSVLPFFLSPFTLLLL